jgi:hypothetical protein
MAISLNADAYAKLLGALEGDDFQDQVCSRLHALIADFQRIPAKPSGDGGLDGLSHGQTCGYCCYGPEQEPFKTNSVGLKDDIVEKFRKDLRKLFEVEVGPNRRLVRTQSVALPSIMGEGNRIKNVYLVVSWFESHRIIGPLNTEFARCKAASALRIVDADATLTIWGPKDLAAKGPIGEHALFLLEERALLAKVKLAIAAGIQPSSTGDFDAKFEDLRQRGAGRIPQINGLSEHFKNAWSTAIALDNELASTSVSLHEALEDARTQSAATAQIRSMSASSPYDLLDGMRREVAANLGQSFGERLGTLTPRVADGEVARLIGECHLDWRQNGA